MSLFFSQDIAYALLSLNLRSSAADRELPSIQASVMLHSMQYLSALWYKPSFLPIGHTLCNLNLGHASVLPPKNDLESIC